MNMRIDLYIHLDSAEGATAKLDQILAQLGVMAQQERTLMKEVDDLTAQVKANEDAEQSAIILINGIAARIAAAGTDPAALKALTDSLKSSGDALAAAVVANTPAAA